MKSFNLDSFQSPITNFKVLNIDFIKTKSLFSIKLYLVFWEIDKNKLGVTIWYQSKVSGTEVRIPCWESG